jgi:stearoyl-CoA desaturase (Delta-9 desaturase)
MDARGTGAVHTLGMETSTHTSDATEPSAAKASGGGWTKLPWPLMTVHAATLAAVIFTGWSWRGLGLAAVLYFVRMAFVTAGYHRYFSHRAFDTSRFFQFVLALAAQSGAQRSVLWWASHHRWHHRYADEVQDAHSPKQRGLAFAHVGWLLSRSWNDFDRQRVADFWRFPELRWLAGNYTQHLPAALFGLACLLIGGVHGFVWGFLVSTILLWHGSFAVNSLGHWWGGRRYATPDESRNNWVMAIFTTGEGWHNNHHHYPSSVRQGFFWWEFDPTYYVLRGLAALGIVWNLRYAPAAVLAGPLVDKRPSSTGKLAA